MAKLLQKLTSKISNWLRAKPLPRVSARRPKGYQAAKVPPVPGRAPISPAFRGITAESLPGRMIGAETEENLLELPQEQWDWLVTEHGDFTEEEVANWELVPESEVYGFVHNYDVLQVASSNVVAVQYDKANEKLRVEFGAKAGGGEFYEYDGVSPVEADRFARSPSKGSEIWTYYRVRGTKYGHRKSYRKVGGFLDPRTMQERGGSIHS